MKNNRGRKWFWFWMAVGGLFLILLLIVPQPRFNKPLATVVESSDGSLLGAHIAADGQWRFPKPDSLPSKYRTALLAYEDRWFMYHPGINPVSIVRSLVQNVKSGRIVSGGSTITMQVARMSGDNPPRTISRKLVEMAMAVKMELLHSKENILMTYAANAPFGGNIVGIEAAAWRYFGRASWQLSWGEAAMLAVLPNAPSLIWPGRNSDQLLKKRNILLETLYARGTIDSLTCVLACSEPLPSGPVSLPRLTPALTDRLLVTGPGRRYRTTVDYHLQEQVNALAAMNLEVNAAGGAHNIAALVIEVETGNILAYTGNISSPGEMHGGDVDMITAPRSTGSILKPFLYAAMLESGELLPGMLVRDVPVEFDGYSPKNFDLQYRGAVRAAAALSRSLNVPAVEMLRTHTPGRFLLLLRTLGFTTFNRDATHYGLSLILGGGEANLLELTGCYARMAALLNSANDVSLSPSSSSPSSPSSSSPLSSSSSSSSSSPLSLPPSLYQSPSYLLQQAEISPPAPGIRRYSSAVISANLSGLVFLPFQPHNSTAAISSTLQHHNSTAAISSTPRPQDSTSVSAPRFQHHNSTAAISSIPQTQSLSSSPSFPLSAGAIWLTFKALREVNRPEDFAGWENFSSSAAVAWKTGTSFGFRDAWAIGVSPRYAVGVWAGNADGEGVSGLTGLSAAAPLLFDILDYLRPQGWFDEPLTGLEELEVCRASGHIASPFCETREKVLAPAAGVQTSMCPYHLLVHLSGDERYRVTEGCYSGNDIIHRSWFVLPPGMEWFYRRAHPDYRALPPMYPGCVDDQSVQSIELLYPGNSGAIYVPLEHDGSRGRVIFEAAHRNPRERLFWHLDNHFVAETEILHQVALNPEPGEHLITIMDGSGNTLRRRFVIIDKR